MTEVLTRLGLDGDAEFARAVRRHEAARAAGARAGRARPTCCCSTSRPTISTSTRSPGSRDAARLAGSLVFVTHDRALPARAGDAHRRDRSRPAHQLARRLRQLSAPPRGAPARRSAGERALRQAAGAGRSVDPPGHQGAAHAQRRPRARAGGDAQRTRRTARAAGNGKHGRRRKRGVGQEGDRALERVVRLRRSQAIVRDFTTTILRGDRIGLIGANGSGQDHAAEAAARRAGAATRARSSCGTQLQIAYFDQHRAHAARGSNALDNVAEGREFIEIDGARKHVLGYLQDFLFSPERARAPITRAVRRRAQPPAAGASCSPSRRTCW